MVSFWEAKEELEKLAHNDSLLNIGLIIRDFSFSVSENMQSLLSKLHSNTYNLRLFLFIPLSEEEFAFFTVFYRNKENHTEKTIEIRKLEDYVYHSNIMFLDLSTPSVEILFLLNSPPKDLIEEIENYKEYPTFVTRTSCEEFVIVKFVIKNFVLNYNYCEKVL